MKTLIKKLHQVNKNVSLFIFIFGLLLSFNSNLKAEFDTLWTKDDLRIYGDPNSEAAGFINDSIAVITCYLHNHKDSIPESIEELGYHNPTYVVNYNVNSMSITHVYETQDTTLTPSSSTFNNKRFFYYRLSKDKTKLICAKTGGTTSKLYILNTSNGSLDTIIDFGNYPISIDYQVMYNGNISLFSKNPQLYIGELNMNDYSYNFYLLPDCINDDDKFFNYSQALIVKSQLSNVNEEVILNTQSLRMETFNYDSIKVTSECEKSKIAVGGYSNFTKYFSNIYPFENDKYFFIKGTRGLYIYETEYFSETVFDEPKFERFTLNNPDLYFGYIGKNEDLKIFFIDCIERDSNDSLISSIKIFDYNNNLFIDSIYLDLFDHPKIERHLRGIKYIYPTSDTIAYTFIGGTVIKFYIDISNDTNGRDVERNNLQIYPNPVSNQLNISSKDEVNNVKIIDLLGREIYNSNSILKQIDVSFLETGIYYIVINNKHSLKFIKD